MNNLSPFLYDGNYSLYVLGGIASTILEINYPKTNITSSFVSTFSNAPAMSTTEELQYAVASIVVVISTDSVDTVSDMAARNMPANLLS